MSCTNIEKQILGEWAKTKNNTKVAELVVKDVITDIEQAKTFEYDLQVFCILCSLDKKDRKRSKVIYNILDSLYEENMLLYLAGVK